MAKLKNAGNENLNITIFLLLYGTILKNIIFQYTTFVFSVQYITGDLF